MGELFNDGKFGGNCRIAGLADCRAGCIMALDFVAIKCSQHLLIPLDLILRLPINLLITYLPFWSSRICWWDPVSASFVWWVICLKVVTINQHSSCSHHSLALISVSWHHWVRYGQDLFSKPGSLKVRQWQVANSPKKTCSGVSCEASSKAFADGETPSNISGRLLQYYQGTKHQYHQDTKGVLKTKSCVTKPISLGFVVPRGLLQNPLWMSRANAQPCLSPPISHGAHLETSSGSPAFKRWDMWGFQLPALISSIKSAIFPFFNSPVGCFSSLSGPLFIHF